DLLVYTCSPDPGHTAGDTRSRADDPALSTTYPPSSRRETGTDLIDTGPVIRGNPRRIGPIGQHQDRRPRCGCVSLLLRPVLPTIEVEPTVGARRTHRPVATRPRPMQR